jgi:hypothetical protein
VKVYLKVNISSKKKILKIIIDSIQSEETIDALYDLAGSALDDDDAPPKSKPKPVKEPVKTVEVKVYPGTSSNSRIGTTHKVTIHGRQYKNLRHAVTKVWKLSQADYESIRHKRSKGESLDDLLPKKKEPPKIVYPVDKQGIAVTAIR